MDFCLALKRFILSLNLLKHKDSKHLRNATIGYTLLNIFFASAFSSGNNEAMKHQISFPSTAQLWLIQVMNNS